jgi:hypothetical protein
MFSDKEVREELVPSCPITLRDWHAAWASREKGAICDRRSRSSIQGKHQQTGILPQGNLTAQSTGSCIKILYSLGSGRDGFRAGI